MDGRLRIEKAKLQWLNKLDAQNLLAVKETEKVEAAEAALAEAERGQLAVHQKAMALLGDCKKDRVSQDREVLTLGLTPEECEYFNYEKAASLNNEIKELQSQVQDLGGEGQEHLKQLAEEHLDEKVAEKQRRENMKKSIIGKQGAVINDLERGAGQDEEDEDVFVEGFADARSSFRRGGGGRKSKRRRKSKKPKSRKSKSRSKKSKKRKSHKRKSRRR